MQEWLTDNAGVFWGLVWDAGVAVAVPLAVAALAAGFVVSQLKQADKHRDAGRRERLADRRAQGISELCQMMIANADLVIRIIDRSLEVHRARANGVDLPGGPTITQLDRFRHNEYYVRAQAHLAEDTAAVGNWALAQSEKIFDLGLTTLRSEGDPGRKVGEARRASMSTAVDASKALLAWLRGDLPTEWFEQQLSDPSPIRDGK